MAEYLHGSYRVSERRACRVARMHRATFRYRSHRDPRTELRMRIREIAQVRVRYGYRKIRVLLNRRFSVYCSVPVVTSEAGFVPAVTKPSDVKVPKLGSIE